MQYHGLVEDLCAEYAKTRVYIGSIMFGGGIRTKILEAMTAGVPVVSTHFAPLGIGTTPGTHLIAADDPQEYANGVVQLLHDDAAWWRIRRNARRFIEQHYSLQANGPAVARAYREYLAKDRSDAASKETAA